MMPTKQRCPSCGTEFMGSDAIGDPCDECKRGDQMKTLKLGICFLDMEDNIIAKKVVEANWSINLETDVNKFFDIDIQKEVATILAEHLKLETTPDVIREMLLECRSELEKG